MARIAQWQKFIQDTVTALKERSDENLWELREEPEIGQNLRPDLVVASREGGAQYVVEIKGRSAGDTTFSDLAQVSAYAKALGSTAVPVIATNLSVSGDLLELARELGVRVVARRNPRDLADGIMKEIESPAPVVA